MSDLDHWHKIDWEKSLITYIVSVEKAERKLYEHGIWDLHANGSSRAGWWTRRMQIRFPPELCKAHNRTDLPSFTSFPKATYIVSSITGVIEVPSEVSSLLPILPETSIVCPRKLRNLKYYTHHSQENNTGNFNHEKPSSWNTRGSRRSLP